MVAVDRIDPNSRLARWGADRLRPKVIVATQTRVIEAIVDRTGRCWPSTPAIALHPADPGAEPRLARWDAVDHDEVLWRLAAAVMAPHATAWALTMYPGAGLVAGAVKLSARQVMAIPLPGADGDAAWAEAAVELRDATGAADRRDGERWLASMRSFGRSMVTAHAGDGSAEVLEWWWSRMPPWRA